MRTGDSRNDAPGSHRIFQRLPSPVGDRYPSVLWLICRQSNDLGFLVLADGDRMARTGRITQQNSQFSAVPSLTEVASQMISFESLKLTGKALPALAPTADRVPSNCALFGHHTFVC